MSRPEGHFETCSPAYSWLADKKMALMPKFPRRHYGQNVVVRMPTPMRGKLYARNGAKECARRIRQMERSGP